MKNINILVISLLISCFNLIMSEQQSINSIEYVVAHYNEDLNWLLPYADKTHIYYKGPLNVRSDVFAKWTKLPNIGREGHTYLFHIINNYNNLADITFFLQGRIADHAHGKTIDDLLPEVIDHKIAFLGHPYHPRYGSDNNGYRSFLKFCQNVFHTEIPKNIVFYPGACFGVTKELIHRHSIEFYQHILRYVDYSICPYEGYHLERIWFFIFDPISATWDK